MQALIPLVLLVFVFYALLIRPQQRRARDHQALMAAVQVGEEIMTTAGIFGRVTSVEDDVISLEISPGVVMRVARAAVGRRMTAEPEPEPELELESGDDLPEDDSHAASTDPDTPPSEPDHQNGEPPAAPTGSA
jgi:preprotein translocase subunit YajC